MPSLCAISTADTRSWSHAAAPINAVMEEGANGGLADPAIPRSFEELGDPWGVEQCQIEALQSGDED